MERTLRTDIIVNASSLRRGYFITYPTVTTSILDERGTTSTNIQRINEAHIRHFTGLRLEYINDNNSVICRCIVLNYDPVKQIHVTAVAQ
jgi:hypothetical protein